MPTLGPRYRVGADKISAFSVYETESDTVINDNENIVWRNLGAQLREIDLSPNKREQVIETMETQYLASPLAKIILVWWTDFILGRGFYPMTNDQEANKILEEFWYSPVNDMPVNSRTFVKELCFYGELAILSKVNPASGFCGLTIIPSSEIADLEEKPGFPGEILRVKTRSDNSYDVINWDSKKGEYDGECFLHRINRLAGHVRGYPDLIPLLDWTNIFESYAYNKLERDAQQYGVWWDVTLEGKTEEEIREWEAQMGGTSPKAGSSIIHNERVNWELLQPQRTYYTSRDGEFFLNFILGTSGLKDMGATKDSTGELLNPAINSMNCRQQDVYNFMIKIAQFQLQEAIKAGRLKKKPYKVTVSSQRIGVRDIQRSSGSLARISNSLGDAVDRDWVNNEEAGRVYRDLLYRLDLMEQPEIAEQETEKKGGGKEEEESGLFKSQ